MTQWEYKITVHEFPEGLAERSSRTIHCDQKGGCFVHDLFQTGIDWLEDIFREKGEEGWELIQLGYHQKELLCIWKRRKPPEEEN